MAARQAVLTHCFLQTLFVGCFCSDVFLSFCFPVVTLEIIDWSHRVVKIDSTIHKLFYGGAGSVHNNYC